GVVVEHPTPRLARISLVVVLYLNQPDGSFARNIELRISASTGTIQFFLSEVEDSCSSHLFLLCQVGCWFLQGVCLDEQITLHLDTATGWRPHPVIEGNTVLCLLIPTSVRIFQNYILLVGAPNEADGGAKHLPHHRCDG